MNKAIKLIISILIIVNNVTAQNQQQLPTIKWYSFKEAIQLAEKSPRKIFIDMYTDWCGWCKTMDKNTFSDPGIAFYLNNFYYPVKFNAETFDTIEYKGITYYNKMTTDPTYKDMPKTRKLTHDLALLLLNNKPSYPTIVYLDEKGELITAVPGYMQPSKLEPILIYFKEDLHKAIPFEDFASNFDSTFHAVNPPTKNLVTWYSLEKAMELAKKNNKKIYINMYADWSATCKMMQTITYNNPYIAKYINEHYYAVNFNIASKDTIVFKEKKYYNEGKEHPYHQLAVILMNGNMNIPAAIYMESNGGLISLIPGYLTAKGLEPWLDFFAKEYYKTSTLEEFRKNFKSNIPNNSSASPVK